MKNRIYLGISAKCRAQGGSRECVPRAQARKELKRTEKRKMEIAGN